jgi:hypothetical protein
MVVKPSATCIALIDFEKKNGKMYDAFWKFMACVAAKAQKREIFAT